MQVPPSSQLNLAQSFLGHHWAFIPPSIPLQISCHPSRKDRYLDPDQPSHSCSKPVGLSCNWLSAPDSENLANNCGDLAGPADLAFQVKARPRVHASRLRQRQIFSMYKALVNNQLGSFCCTLMHLC